MPETIEIGSTKPRVRYECDGTITEFDFNFNIFEADNINVYVNDQLLTNGYLVNKTANGGSVTFDTAPAQGTIITIYRNLELKRTTNFQEVGPFRTSKVNLEFDYQLACLEQLQDNIARTVTFPPYAPTQLNVALPMPTPGRAIIWNESGNSLKNSEIEIEKLISCYSDILEKYKIITAATAQTLASSASASSSAAQAADSIIVMNERSETIYTSEKDLGSVSENCTINIEPGFFEYKVSPTANTAFSFNFDNCNTNKIISFSLLLKQSATAYTYTYTFPGTTSFYWLDGFAASPTGSYLLTFRRYPEGYVVGVANGVIAS